VVVNFAQSFGGTGTGTEIFRLNMSTGDTAPLNYTTTIDLADGLSVSLPVLYDTVLRRTRPGTTASGTRRSRSYEPENVQPDQVRGRVQPSANSATITSVSTASAAPLAPPARQARQARPAPREPRARPVRVSRPEAPPARRSRRSARPTTTRTGQRSAAARSRTSTTSATSPSLPPRTRTSSTGTPAPATGDPARRCCRCSPTRKAT
jgi:hypothetical protein